MMKTFVAILLLIPLLPVLSAQQAEVRIAGDWTTFGHTAPATAIIADTIQARHLYAIGWPADLRGEIFLWDNMAVVASITSDTRETYVRRNVKNLDAAVLLYADVPVWDTIELLQRIPSLQALAVAIAEAAVRHGTDTTRTFPFLLLGKITTGQGQILFPENPIQDITPEALEESLFRYPIRDKRAQMIGFYSPTGAFSADSNRVRIHFRLQNKYQAGHLSAADFDASEPIKLFLPKQL